MLRLFPPKSFFVSWVLVKSAHSLVSERVSTDGRNWKGMTGKQGKDGSDWKGKGKTEENGRVSERRKNRREREREREWEWESRGQERRMGWWAWMEEEWTEMGEWTDMGGKGRWQCGWKGLEGNGGAGWNEVEGNGWRQTEGEGVDGHGLGIDSVDATAGNGCGQGRMV